MGGNSRLEYWAGNPVMNVVVPVDPSNAGHAADLDDDTLSSAQSGAGQ